MRQLLRSVQDKNPHLHFTRYKIRRSAGPQIRMAVVHFRTLVTLTLTLTLRSVIWTRADPHFTRKRRLLTSYLVPYRSYRSVLFKCNSAHFRQ